MRSGTYAAEVATVKEQELSILDSIHTYIESQFTHTKSLSPTQLGTGFCKWCLTEIFELPEETAEDAMEVSGAHDNGIDAAFEQFGHLYLIQTKYNKAHSYDALEGFIERTRQLEQGFMTGNRPAVLSAFEALKDQMDGAKKIFYYYITNAQFSSSEKERINNQKRSLGNAYRILDLSKIVEVLTERFTVLPESFRSKNFVLHAEVPPIQLDGSLVLPVKLSDLAQFVSEAKEFLYHSNIRNYLRRTSINRGLERTLAGEPENFWYYNNGITIVCDSFNLEGQLVTLTAPQVVNGCQTTYTIRSCVGAARKRETSFRAECWFGSLKELASSSVPRSHGTQIARTR